MIELRNIYKTYRVKNAPEVRALDGVSLVFGDTGLDFILGKSGAGKSTLLNVIGGLDRIDEGEILIKGKSCKDFTQADFDSYRNTFLGFIFQEYNILNEFTVAENIALAIQLQHRKPTSEEIDGILNEVDLAGLGARKPNELSGGQKQRVAIARALVKKPEIILADEPTGALDSKTGRQVFDTLKKLSKTHLVIVVSHDREFAEYYGDRVIEMKDGRVLSDISKHQVERAEGESPFAVIDDNLIAIKPGYALSANDLQTLNEHLAHAKDVTYISGDPTINKSLKEAAKINEEGNREIFKETILSDVKSATSDPRDFQLIRSHLPFRDSLRMAFSSLKAKPFRLVMTFLLSITALTMFGVADTLAGYNERDAYSESLHQQGVNYATMRAFEHIKNGNSDYYTGLMMSDEDVTQLSKDTGVNYHPILAPGLIATSRAQLDDSFNDSLGKSVPTYEGIFSKYHGSPNALSAMSKADLLAEGFSVKESAEGFPVSGDLSHCAITEYLFHFVQKYGWSHGQESAAVGVSEEDFLALKPTLKLDYTYVGDTNGSVATITSGSARTRTLTISAIVDTHLDEAQYDFLTTYSSTNQEEYLRAMLLNSRFNGEYTYGYPGLLFTSKAFQSDWTAIDLSPTNKDFYFMAIAPMPTGTSALDKMIAYMYENGTDERSFRLVNGLSDIFVSVNSIVTMMKPIFFWVGFVFAVFAAFLLMTFIATSIAYKKREIGILRAVGARGLDIYGIFFNEAQIICLISWFIGAILAGVIAFSMNRSMVQDYGLPVTLFNFRIRQVLVVLAVAFLSGGVASFLPSFFIARKKPIDSINDK